MKYVSPISMFLDGQSETLAEPSHLMEAIRLEYGLAECAIGKALDHMERVGLALEQYPDLVMPVSRTLLKNKGKPGQSEAKRISRLPRVAASMTPEAHRAIIPQMLREAVKVYTRSNTSAVLGSSEDESWFTPVPVVDRVVDCMGQIDLDPCGHPDSPVRCIRRFTKEDDGLPREWQGRVYLNPPYGGLCPIWITKLLEEFDAGRTTEAVVLVASRPDTKWYALLDPFPRCQVRGRLKFSNSSGSAPFPSTIFYLGSNVAAFEEAFRDMGTIYVPFRSQMSALVRADAEGRS